MVEAVWLLVKVEEDVLCSHLLLRVVACIRSGMAVCQAGAASARAGSMPRRTFVEDMAHAFKLGQRRRLHSVGARDG